MITVQVFMTGLLAVSILTSLTTQALKKLMRECGTKVHSNIMASIVAVVIAVALGVAWAITKHIPFDAFYICCLIALSFLGWLCAVLGYDKVKQAVKQIIEGGNIDKVEEKDGKNNNDE